MPCETKSCMQPYVEVFGGSFSAFGASYVYGKMKGLPDGDRVKIKVKDV